jgi:hypothetical protein
MQKELSDYITKARANDMSNDVIKQELLKAGWAESDVNNALELSVPIAPTAPLAPEPNNTSGIYRHFSHPLNSIGYFLSLVSLAILIYSICYVFLTTISFYFPEQGKLDESFFSMGSLDTFLNRMASALAGVIISAPLYIAITFFSRKYEENYSLIRKSFSRKFHLFATIIITFLIIIGYFVWFLYSLLLNEVSLNKFMTFIAIAGANIIPFIYYLIQLKEDRKYEN